MPGVVILWGTRNSTSCAPNEWPLRGHLSPSGSKSPQKSRASDDITTGKSDLRIASRCSKPRSVLRGLYALRGLYRGESRQNLCSCFYWPYGSTGVSFWPIKGDSHNPVSVTTTNLATLGGIASRYGVKNSRIIYSAIENTDGNKRNIKAFGTKCPC